MKRASITLMLFILSSMVCKSQNWPPIGTTWHYGGYYQNYYKITCEKDTLIKSTVCKKLKIKEFWHNKNNKTTDSSLRGFEYLYSDSNKVYIYKHKIFYTLYDFSAKVGDKWIVPEINHILQYDNRRSCDTTGTIKVDSIGKINIAGKNLRYIRVSCDEIADKQWGWNNTRIIEHIGAINEYFFSLKKNAYPNCGIIPDLPTPGGIFYCYSDNLLNYKNDTISDCAYIDTSKGGGAFVPQFNVHKPQIKIFPNPYSDYAEIQVAEDERISPNEKIILKVYDIIGNEVKTIDLTGKTDYLLSKWFLPGGMYFYTVYMGTNPKEIQFGRIVIIQ